MSDASRRLQYLEAMGIQAWIARDAVPARVAEPAPEYSSAETSIEAGGGEVACLDWDALQARVADCALCELEKTRTQTVFGVGNQSAKWMVIGEAPGAEEDRQGEPFVGRAGQLLNEMLWALGLAREAVYIANVLKCRPPGNRDPSPEEVACCEPYLKRQVALIQPKIILAVGRIAAQNLLKTDTPIGALRGRVHRYADTGIPLVVTYHPAYLLRSPLEKRKAWEDLQLAARTPSAARAETRMSTVRSDIPSRPAPAPSFRAMRIADLPAVMDIELRAYDFAWTEGIFRDCLAVGYRCHVVLQDGKIAGYGVASAAAGEAHILNLCIDPNQRRRGLGRALLTCLLKDAGAAGAKTMLLEVRKSNAAGIALYEQMGFKRIGMRKDYYPVKSGREDAILLERKFN